MKDYIASLIRQIVGRLRMAHFKVMKWQGYRAKLSPAKDDVRTLIGTLLPYFWDSDISLNLNVKPDKKLKADETLKYQWELCDLDNNVKKRGYGEIEIPHVRLLLDRAFYQDRAITLGNLHPHRYYRIYITFTDSLNTSERLLAGSLTIKDRDELYMQLFVLLVGIAFAFFLLLLEMGGS